MRVKERGIFFEIHTQEEVVQCSPLLCPPQPGPLPPAGLCDIHDRN